MESCAPRPANLSCGDIRESLGERIARRRALASFTLDWTLDAVAMVDNAV